MRHFEHHNEWFNERNGNKSQMICILSVGKRDAHLFVCLLFFIFLSFNDPCWQAFEMPSQWNNTLDQCPAKLYSYTLCTRHNESDRKKALTKCEKIRSKQQTKTASYTKSESVCFVFSVAVASPRVSVWRRSVLCCGLCCIQMSGIEDKQPSHCNGCVHFNLMLCFNNGRD